MFSYDREPEPDAKNTPPEAGNVFESSLYLSSPFSFPPGSQISVAFRLRRRCFSLMKYLRKEAVRPMSETENGKVTVKKIKDNNPVRRNVRAKLLSAAAMLLLSAIMLTATTYAWITISVNPEVKEIRTTVAGNGYLQVALLGTTTSGTGTNIISHPTGGGRGQSTAAGTPVTDANNTYGNIIDLTTGYGLESILLTPSRLNLITQGSSILLNTQYPLKIPVYGKDGRIIRLDEAPKTHYDPDSQLYEDTAHWGVNVIGFKSELNDAQNQNVVRSVSRESIRAEAAEYVYFYRNQIRDHLISTIEEASDDIFGVINKTTLILQLTNQTWNADDIRCVRNISDMLSQVATESDSAIRWAFLAYCVSDTVHFDSEDEEDMADLGRIYKQFLTMPMMAGTGDTSSFNIRGIAETNGYSTLVTAIDAIDQVKTRVAAANVYLDAGQPGNAGACIISVTGSYIMNGGQTPNPVFVLNSNGRILTSASRGYFYNLKTGRTEDIFFFVGSNSVSSDGLFQAMARVVGDYTATLTSTFKYWVYPERTYSYDLMVTSLNTSTLSRYDENTNTGTLGQVYKAVSEIQTSGTVPLEINRFGVNAYGYSVDLAFLSNETAPLILETKGLDRITGKTESAAISDGSYSEERQGGGSVFSFTRALDMSEEAIIQLLGCLRIVFSATDGQIYAVGLPSSPVFRDDKVTGVIHLYNIDRTATATTGILTLGSKINNNSITTIQRNREIDITVTVYLDGDATMAATLGASRNYSLNGMINLQFSSGAELIPAYDR